MLPEYVRKHLRLKEQFAEPELNQALDQLERPFLRLIYSEEGIEFLRRIILDGGESSCVVEIIPRVGNNDTWRFAEFSVGSSAVLDVVCIPKQTPMDEPPTKVEELLIRAWLSRQEVVNDHAGSSSGLSMGQTLLFWRGASPQFDRKEQVKRVASLLLGFSEDSPSFSYTESWGTYTSFALSENPRAVLGNAKLTELLRIATKETSIRWKFLGFYRVIEFGYLSNVLAGITQEFLKDPTATVDEAAQALKNEFNQFRKLSSEYNLDSIFEDLLTEFEQLVGNFNSFACALNKRLKNDGRLKNHPGRAAKGVLITYLIRCSIVHAGEGSLLFESYADAEVSLAAMVGHLERAVMSYLGITGI